MEVYAIPIEDSPDKFIIYRPLRKLAFIGNRGLVNLVNDIARVPEEADNPVVIPDNIRQFLTHIGFFTPDMPTPHAPAHQFNPTSAVLLTTNRCNLRCVYCYANAGVMPAEDISLDVAKVAIDRVAENVARIGLARFELVFHGGGEPMQAWTLIKQATTYAHSKAIPAFISMVSNGIWSPAQLDWVLHNLDGLTISLDGSPQTQDTQRPLASGEGSAKYTLKTIKALDEAGFSYGIRMTATTPWRGKLPEDVRFICENTACHTIQVEPAFNIQRGEHQEANRRESEAFRDAFLEAFDIAAQSGRRLIYSGARPWLLTGAFCMAPYNALIVNGAGNMVTCYEIASNSHDLSDISTIGRVVDGQVEVNAAAREKFTDFMADKRTSQCKNCFCRWHCAGDCYTRSTLVEDGELIASTARCYTNRSITAELLLWYIMENGGVWQGQQFSNGQQKKSART